MFRELLIGPKADLRSALLVIYIFHMKRDTLKEYKSLRNALHREKEALEARLHEVNAVLGDAGAPGKVSAGKTKRKVRKRLKNPMSLSTAVVKVTSDKALTKQEILAEVGKLGYKFAASNPVNSLNATLYAKGKFKKTQGGKFSPAKK
ncbi:MAG: hypothetical protein ABI651_15045 [Verrucomicrobiota bacterium]